LPAIGDFGMEAQCPNFVDISCKVICIKNFIAQCELSIVIANIMRFVERRALVAEATVTACNEIQEYGANATELDEVTFLHLELVNWSKKFEKSLKQGHWNKLMLVVCLAK
jgi:hypothetical protein